MTADLLVCIIDHAGTSRLELRVFCGRCGQVLAAHEFDVELDDLEHACALADQDGTAAAQHRCPSA